MSISMIVSNPVVEEQQQVNIPVATDKFFKDFWMPMAESLRLTYVPLFMSGIEVGKQELADVLAELRLLKEWSVQRNQTPEGKQMLERLDRLVQQLPAIVSDQTKVFIG